VSWGCGRMTTAAKLVDEAKLTVEVGLNLQPGLGRAINCLVDAARARPVAAEVHAAGTQFVDVVHADQDVRRAHIPGLRGGSARLVSPTARAARQDSTRARRGARRGARARAPRRARPGRRPTLPYRRPRALGPGSGARRVAGGQLRRQHAFRGGLHDPPRAPRRAATYPGQLGAIPLVDAARRCSRRTSAW